MNKVDFYSLPRAVQDRLLDSLRGEFAPKPILVRPGARQHLASWLGLSAGAVALLGLLYRVGFGNSASALSQHPTPVAGVYALLVAAAAAGLLQAAAERGRVRSLPFAPGVYLFPANVIDARAHVLRVFHLGELSTLAPGPGPSLSLGFGSERFQLPLADASRASEAVSLVEAARDRVKTELDSKTRFELDPLEPPSMASPLGPQLPRVRVVPIWDRFAWGIAILTGCLFGIGLFQLRNRASDNRMLADAQARDDVAAYQSYLLHGRRHHDLVASVLLPRAELRVAVGKGSVEAIDEFEREHEKTGIQNEVDLARRTALVAAFERARGAGTLAALLAFDAQYPNHGLGPSLAQARHALFVRARERYRQSAPADADKSIDTISRLLAYAERVGARKQGDKMVGPAVQIRFERIPSQTLDRADSAVSKNPMFNGPISFPSRYFDAAKLLPHEEQLARQIAERFGKAFEPEMLVFEPGPPIEGVGDGVPDVKAPSIIVSYKIEWSGGAFASKKPRGVLIGLFMFYKTLFVLPGDSEVQRGKYTAQVNIPRDVLDEFPGVPPAGAVETAIYKTMLDSTFDEFRTQYLGKWFK